VFLAQVTPEIPYLPMIHYMAVAAHKFAGVGLEKEFTQKALAIR